MHTAKYAALALAVVAMLAVSAALTVLLLDANALRAPISGYMSRMLDRAFAINGDLRIALSDGPRLEMNKVVLGNAAWGSRPAMLTVERVVVAIDLTSLLKGRLVLPVVALSRPDVLLEQNLDGKANWTFGAAHASTPSARPVEVGSLWIEGGEARFRDPAAQTDVTVKVDSERSAHDSQVTLHFTGQGSFRNEPFRLQGRAVAPLERRQAGTHYRLEVQASAGDTKTAFTGTLVPLAFETIDGELTLSGPDLATLYPLVPVPLPWTPAYRVSGHFVRDRETYALHGLHGQIGNSDIEGTVALDISRARPRFNGDLVSRRLDYQDLLGFLGVPPPSRGQPRPAAQEEEAARRRQARKVLSAKPYQLDRLLAVDGKVQFKASAITGGRLPLDDMTVRVELEDGKLRLSPLDFGIAGGHVTSRITLDATAAPATTEADATISNLEVKALLPELKRSRGSAGKLGGRVKLSMEGNSIAQLAASGNGELALILSHGRLSTMALVLTNLDLANAAKYLLRGDPDAPVYCAVASASMREGRVVPSFLVIDSSEEHISGEGVIDFADERYDLHLAADAKHPSLVALRGPIRVGGTFKDPEVQPEVGPVAARVGAAVALGAFLTPVAALLALVDPGDGKDANCAALIESARRAVAATPVVSPERAPPAERTRPARSDR